MQADQDPYPERSIGEPEIGEPKEPQLAPTELPAVAAFLDSLHELLEHEVKHVRRVQELTERVEELERTIENVMIDVSRHAATLEELEDRLGHKLDELTIQRDDLSDIRHIDNIQIADDYRIFVEQRLHSASMRHLGDFKLRVKGKSRLPRVIRSLCKRLFGASSVDESSLLSLVRSASDEWSQTVADLCEEARVIHRRVEDTGLPFHWSWEAILGDPIDEDLQEAWGSCDPEGPIEFVVTPAYIVDGMVYCPQRVFTSTS